MANLTRFGVSIENSMLEKFDALIRKKKYTNRSKAIGDMIRNMIVEEEWEKGDGESIGTINIVYDHHKKGLSSVLNRIQHDYHSLIVSDTHVHLDHDNCLDVIIVRGKIRIIKLIADKLTSARGVKFGRLTVATKGKDLK
ncbi:MAG TPA: nickel-responsive transcriptional regulator NikR [Candidatus Goldiibacteriota bacterium]|nr:nickel-responsive transcriptional regulator NikR [Candidatus Goldiibacteriota bacterium]